MRRQPAPLMRFTRPPNLRWHKQPPPVSGITWCGLCRRAPLRLFDVPDDVWRHYLGPDQRRTLNRPRQIAARAAWASFK